MVRRDRSYKVDRGRTTSTIRGEGSGASRDFGLKQTRWRAEGRQAAKHKCLISSRFPSLTRVTGGSPAAEHGLLSADAPEPYRDGQRKNLYLPKSYGARRLLSGSDQGASPLWHGRPTQLSRSFRANLAETHLLRRRPKRSCGRWLS